MQQSALLQIRSAGRSDMNTIGHTMNQNSTKSPKQRIKLLIVNNKQHIRDRLFDILRKNGYASFDFAKDGVEAYSKLKEQVFNFVITDWHMPRMSGIELLTALRSDPQYFDTPVMMISDELSEDKIYYAMEEGVDGYHTLPFTEKKIINGITEVLMRKSDPDPLRYKIQRLCSLKLQEKYNNAIEFGKTLLREHMRTDILFLMSNCYMDANEPDNARRCIKRALKIEESSKGYHLLGTVYMREGEYEKAIENYEKAYSLNQLNRNIVVDIGRAYLEMGKFKEASETFSSLDDKTLGMSNVAASKIGNAYLDAGYFDEAGSYLKDAFTPMPEMVSVFNKYAIELRKHGHVKEAVKQYKRCIKIDPDNHIILFNLARIYYEIKNYSESKELLKKCLVLEPNFEAAGKLLAMIKKQ